MNHQLNGSSYYRANPFYQQGYLPDFALKNRKPPSNLVELPQGEQHFDPTNKKHFQRVGYYSTIAQQNIIHNKQQLSSPARDRDYFRSLNVNDIQGATTNTLISKAVKNKLRAKQELMKKKNQQQYLTENSQRQNYYTKIEDEKKQKQALQKMKKGSMPNYHQIVKKLRTQQSQNLKNVINTQQMDQKPNSPIYQRGYFQQQGYNDKNKYNNGKQVKNKDNYDFYVNQLKNTEQQIKYLQMQLSKVKQNRGFRNQHSFNAQNMQNNHYHYQKQQRKMQNEYKIQKQQSERQNKYQNNIEISKNGQYIIQKNPQNNNYHNEKQTKLSINSQIYSQPQQNNLNSYPSKNNYQQYQKSISIKDLEPKEQRQIHRRINPTYLSYASPSIGLAGKNIVGY